MHITSSFVALALYLGFVVALVIPDVRDVSRSGNGLGPVDGREGDGLGSIPEGSDLLPVSCLLGSGSSPIVPLR